MVVVVAWGLRNRGVILEQLRRVSGSLLGDKGARRGRQALLPAECREDPVDAALAADLVEGLPELLFVGLRELPVRTPSLDPRQAVLEELQLLVGPLQVVRA